MGEQEAAVSEKIGEDVRIVCVERAQHREQDGKRATEGVNDVAAVKKAKPSILSTQ